MMRLRTLGRRSGEPRVAIVGYLEDGPNLVTLAMNGWAEAEPACGEERDRLWARWRELSDNYDAWAALRSGPTAVVVLEPRAAAAGG
jgi:hypothetical protein